MLAIVATTMIRHGARLVAPGTTIYVDDANAIALVNAGRASFEKPAQPVAESAPDAPSGEPELTADGAPEASPEPPQEKPKTKRGKR